jgi:hypothetical protein
MNLCFKLSRIYYSVFRLTSIASKLYEVWIPSISISSISYYYNRLMRLYIETFFDTLFHKQYILLLVSMLPIVCLIANWLRSDSSETIISIYLGSSLRYSKLYMKSCSSRSELCKIFVIALRMFICIKISYTSKYCLCLSRRCRKILTHILLLLLILS